MYSVKRNWSELGNQRVKLFDADYKTPKALGKSGIEVMVGIPDDMLVGGSMKAAEKWVAKNDDAHIFCMKSQITKEEVQDVLEFIDYCYTVFEFTYDLKLSTRPEKYLGDLATLERAEAALTEALNESGYPDAIAICRSYGYPDLFITFTCNPKWPEIQEALDLIKGQKPFDRPDLVCRVFLLKAPCMEDGKCSKHFPKSFRRTTMIDESGFVQYLRRDNGVTCKKGNIELDNRFLAHNVDLTVLLDAHINVKVFSHSSVLKYLFKYINKGHDRARVTITCGQAIQSSGEANEPDVHNEIKTFLDCRHIAAHEACWCIFEFDIHFREPSVQRLLYICRDSKVYTFMADKLFIECFVGQAYTKQCLQSGWKLTENTLKQDPCWDDREWQEGILEISHWATSYQIRQFFVILLLFCEVANPLELFEKHWRLMGDDIVYRFRQVFRSPNFNIEDRDLRNYVLIALEDMLNQNGSSLSCHKLPLPEVEDRFRSEDSVMYSARNKLPRMFFVYGYGGTDILDAAICNSPLWQHFEVHNLTINMRLSQPNLDEGRRQSLKQFATWMLDVGDGKIPSVDNQQDREGDVILIPDSLLTRCVGNPVAAIFDSIYDDFQTHYRDADYIKRRKIVTPYNDTTNEINQCYDADSQYPPKFLHSLKLPGIPDHILTLKIRTVIMLMRNISQASGLCNGTRLMGTQIAPHLRGRKPFPVKICYAMTSQGQTLNKVGLYLPKPVFTHGQFYVAISRVTSYEGLKILIHNESAEASWYTLNVVYREIFDSIHSTPT
ncbi:DNA helicase PIF1, ATP-dependent [Corchorus olitorius]|uniref:ATP-dependent DNA helicase n=1 Tax=Corchorus olitorius TaxID=93759 RepID=A0A1R3HGP1_9ROSI|nr:DNA helicase PIF1, ATP-dependent [Corchorus olitorius]